MVMEKIKNKFKKNEGREVNILEKSARIAQQC